MTEQGSATEEALAFEAKARDLRAQLHRMMGRLKAVDNACLGTIETEVSLPEIRMIEVLGDQPGCIMRELADGLHVAVSTATGIVDKLVAKGLVRRERVDEDRRIVRVELSDDGRKIYDAAMEMHLRFCRGMLSSLNDDEREIFLVLMRKIARGGGADPAVPSAGSGPSPCGGMGMADG